MKLLTERLVLRQWRNDDLPAFAAMNSDPRVMEFFPSPLSTKESNALAERIFGHIALHGWGLWALERRDTQAFIGFTGLWPVSFTAPFTCDVEIGWRLNWDSWGFGFATEAARECLRFGFTQLHLAEIVSFTSELNHRSIAVMRRVGMTHDPSDAFLHPKFSPDNPLAKHVLYRA